MVTPSEQIRLDLGLLVDLATEEALEGPQGVEEEVTFEAHPVPLLLLSLSTHIPPALLPLLTPKASLLKACVFLHRQ